MIERIAERVKKGGHFVPDEDVRRRFVRGKRNFWNSCKNSADQWHLYYNMKDNFQLVAIGEKNNLIFIEEGLFEKFSEI